MQHPASISLTLSNPSSEAARSQPAASGIALPQGWASDLRNLTIETDQGVPASHDLRPLAHWHDGSIKWLHVTLLADLPGDGDSTVRLVNTADRSGRATEAGDPIDAAQPDIEAADDSINAARLGINDGPDALVVHCKHATCHFTRLQTDDAPLFSIQSTDSGHSHAIGAALIDADGTALRFQRDRLTVDTGNGRHAATVVVEGHYNTGRGPHLNATWRVTLLHERALGWMDVTLHNPAAARHPGGFWDLGDPGSCTVKEFFLYVPLMSRARADVRCETGGDWMGGQSASWQLRQLSSGGDIENSPVHVLAGGVQPEMPPGYTVMIDGSTGSGGRRASPVLRITPASEATDQTPLLIKPQQFWQHFPGTVERDAERCRLGVFPAESGTPFELQGGERKAHRFTFCIDADPTALDWVDEPLALVAPSDHTCSAGVLRHARDYQSEPGLESLIAIALDPQQGFKAKREMIDEYGWRNFGDLYADHETWNQPDTGVFVSHYNNQYDPIGGFARQYLLSGDRRWFELMDDLARHVLDIDLYHTDEDRAEYNGGLFWHTDHYLPARTASHRTYSTRHREHGSSGGGPGAEHCYTSGLAFHYYLTGEQRSRTAVFRMARWIGHFYDGDGTLLDQSYRLLTQDLPRLLRHRKPGHVAGYRFPLNRGVGNYLNALLDCHELGFESGGVRGSGAQQQSESGHDPQYLEAVERIIADTIGPHDDIAQRDFADVELTWHYTIFLQSLIPLPRDQAHAGTLRCSLPARP